METIEADRDRVPWASETASDADYDVNLWRLLQVATIAVYIFVLASLIGRRQLDNGFVGDFQFPLLTFLQFVFYIGWLKVRQRDQDRRYNLMEAR